MLSAAVGHENNKKLAQQAGKKAAILICISIRLLQFNELDAWPLSAWRWKTKQLATPLLSPTVDPRIN